jgi:hypothetical protein
VFSVRTGLFCREKYIATSPFSGVVKKPKMQIEKKIILCSILAVTIGIATIFPLAFFMQPARAQETDVPWFNVEISNAYYQATTEDENKLFPEGMVPLVNYRTTSYLGLQYTLNPDAADLIQGARMEYFLVRIYSDLGPIENMTIHFGANTIDDYDPSDRFSFVREDWFNTTGSGGCFLSKFNGTLAEALANGMNKGGNGGGYGSSAFANTSLPEKFLNAKNAQTIYIDVSRLGLVTFDGNNTIVTLADSNQIIAHVELTKNDNEFIYGEVPAEQIEHIWPGTLLPSTSKIEPDINVEYP